MTEPITRIVVVGGGSAGFLAALTLRRMLPAIPLTVVHSPDIPVIGVGESTTSAIAVHLHHHLGIHQAEFHREVRPSWKLGLRFEWGATDVPHFNYTFDRYLDKNAPGLGKWLGYYCLTDTKDASTFYALMDRDKSPAALQGSKFTLDPRTTYHLPNERFIAYMQRKSEEAGATVIADEVEGVIQDESGDVASLTLKSGREIAGDLFIDCSGFGSLLLGKTLGSPPSATRMRCSATARWSAPGSATTRSSPTRRSRRWSTAGPGGSSSRRRSRGATCMRRSSSRMTTRQRN